MDCSAYCGVAYYSCWSREARGTRPTRSSDASHWSTKLVLVPSTGWEFKP